MDKHRTLEVKRDVMAANDAAADAFRAEERAKGEFFIDVMASPGAGKTTLLLALIEELRSRDADKVGV